MKAAKLDVTVLDKVIKNAITAMEASKNQIFDIAEGARSEYLAMKRELETVVVEVKEIIAEVDQLEIQYRRARVRLAEVSRDFRRNTEQDIRNAYESANDVQIRLYLSREKELSLRNRRDELQIRMKNMERTIQKAEGLVTQVGVALDYMTGNLSQVGEIVKNAQHQQMFGLKIIQAQEEERKRVAREIHDGPAQLMANVVLRAEIAERMLMKQDIEMVHKELQDLKEMVRNSLSEVRKIIFDLRPMALDDLGLVPTLRKYTMDVSDRTGVLIELTTIGKEMRLPSAMEVAMFRLIQEALSNVVKHAKARNTLIKMEFHQGKVMFIVKDDGIGFNPTSLRQEDARSHFGLMGMRERVDLLEGQMDIQSAHGEGTKLTISIPIKDEV